MSSAPDARKRRWSGAQRGNLVALIGITGTVLRGAIKRAQYLEDALANGVDPATGDKLTLKEQVDLLWKVNRIVRQTAATTTEVIRMERLLLGEPTEIVGSMGLAHVTEEQAIEEIEEAYEAAQRVRARRERESLRSRPTSQGTPRTGRAAASDPRNTPIDPIWADDPEDPELKISIGALIGPGLLLCE